MFLIRTTTKKAPVTMLICLLSSGGRIAQPYVQGNGAAEVTAVIDWSLMEGDRVPVAEVALPVCDCSEAVGPAQMKSRVTQL